jgi:hypothetical protein
MVLGSLSRIVAGTGLTLDHKHNLTARDNSFRSLYISAAMIRRNEENNSLCNQDDLRRRLSNGFGETNGERIDPPLLLDSISARTNHINGPSNVRTISPKSIHRSSDGRISRSLRRPRQLCLDSATSSLSETVPDCSFVLDSKPAARTVSPVRTSLVTKSIGFSAENCDPHGPLKATTRSVSSRSTSTGTNAVRKSPTNPNLDRINLPPALFSMADNVSKTIEIMPGLRVPLRGAEETWNCIEQDFFSPVTCFGCSIELCCIQDASYVLCPVCRVVGPMDTGAGDFGSTVGVGLGFSFDDLFQWQSEIIQRQQDARPSCAGP